MPRIHFSLTYKDYLNRYGKPVPSQGLRFVIFACGFGICLIGLLFARQGDDGSLLPPPGALAVSVGLCLTVLSVPFWFLIKRASVTEQERRSKENYETFFCVPRVLEFDDHGWKFIYGEATNSRPWKDLSSLAHFNNVLVLSDEFAEYIIPERALSAEELKELIARCETALSPQPVKFCVDDNLTLGRFIRANIIYRWTRQRFLISSLYLLGAVFSLLTGYIFAANLSVRPWPLMSAIFLIVPAAEVARDMEKWGEFRSMNSFASIEVSEGSICFRDPKRTWKLRLAWVVEWLETPWDFQLHTDSNQFHLISKAHLDSQQRQELSSLLRSQNRRARP